MNRTQSSSEQFSETAGNDFSEILDLESRGRLGREPFEFTTLKKTHRDRKPQQAHEPKSPSHLLRSPQHQGDLQPVSDDLSRKLAKLTDECWAKDLEIQSLQARLAAQESIAMRLKAESALHQSKLHELNGRQNDFERLLEERDHDVSSLEQAKRRAESELNDFRREKEARIARLEAERTETAEQVENLSAKVRELEATVEAASEEIERIREESARAAMKAQATLAATAQHHSQVTESFRSRENQLINEIDQLQSSKVELERGRRDALETANQLRAALDHQRAQHEGELLKRESDKERAVADLRTRLQEEFQRKFEVVIAENKKFRQMLDYRDTQIETDRNNLKQWQEQLSFLDQHLRQAKDSLKRDRAEIARLAKALTQELQVARNHPFHDHIQFVDSEIARLQVQHAATSALSPARVKIEERIAQMIQERQLLVKSLEDSQRQTDERLTAVGSILKSASALIQPQT